MKTGNEMVSITLYTPRHAAAVMCMFIPRPSMAIKQLIISSFEECYANVLLENDP